MWGVEMFGVGFVLVEGLGVGGFVWCFELEED